MDGVGGKRRWGGKCWQVTEEVEERRRRERGGVEQGRGRREKTPRQKRDRKEGEEKREWGGGSWEPVVMQSTALRVLLLLQLVQVTSIAC